jgi:hypothetical protein
MPRNKFPPTAVVLALPGVSPLLFSSARVSSMYGLGFKSLP